MAIDYNGTITLSTSVSNIDESIDWFKTVLGFSEIFRAPEAGWAEVTTPTEGVSIGLGQNEVLEGALGDMEALQDPHRRRRQVQGSRGLPQDLPGGQAGAQQEKEPGSHEAGRRSPRIRHERHETSGSVRSGLGRREQVGQVALL